MSAPPESRFAATAWLRHDLPMRFPPPIRVAAPLLVFAFGLAATWFEYRLNLDLDLDRHLAELRQTADSNVRHLARLSEELLPTTAPGALQAAVERMADLPHIQIAGVVDGNGRVLADSTGALRGQPAARTPLAPAAMLIAPAGEATAHRNENEQLVLSAYPFRLGTKGNGWALLEFDRAEVVAAARADARAQLVWMASAMALLSFVLWAVLHFGYAARLGRLAEGVRAFGEGKENSPTLPGGSDEVGSLSGAFSTMAAKLRERDAEKARFEREIHETSERERQFIGRNLHDGLGQRLTAASMAANAAVAAMQLDAPEHAARVAEIGRQLREAIAETRALSHGLAPIGLKDEGLMQALHTLALDTARSSGVHCVFECLEPVCVDDATVAVHLYRIAQEAVTNALKHASPGEIRIALESREGAVRLEVEDDGEGLPENFAAGGGMGLRVMRHRAELAGGSLESRPAPAGGTLISCSIKLPS